MRAIDARGYDTEFFYDDCFGAPNGEARTNSAPIELSSVGKSSYALLTKVKNALDQYAYAQYDYNLGKAVDGEDMNGVVSSGYFESATNPESGTTSYTYDNNGNLLTKTDARTFVRTITYDALNRPTSKSYQNDGGTTPAVAFFYDSQTLPAGAPTFNRGYSTGRLVAVTYGGGSAGDYFGADALGRTLRRIQQTDSVNYLVEASYNVSGAMTSATYPSVSGASDRRTISYSFDTAGRLSSLSSSATSYAPPVSVSNLSYASSGALASETYGNGLIHAATYNNRLQTSEIKLGTSGNPTSILSLAYNYGTTNNNGNAQSVSYNGGGLSYTQSFTYDPLNRLQTAQENSGSSWSQTNGYDRYGNRWIDLGGGNQSIYVSTSTNRITNAGFIYDSSGNLTNDTIKRIQLRCRGPHQNRQCRDGLCLRWRWSAGAETGGREYTICLRPGR